MSISLMFESILLCSYFHYPGPGAKLPVRIPNASPTRNHSAISVLVVVPLIYSVYTMVETFSFFWPSIG